MSIIMNVSRHMAEVPREKWPFMPAWETEPLKVWLSNEYLAVLYRHRADGNMRLTVNRTRRNGRDWRDGITWDELQRIKNECLGEDVWCVECYPAQDKLVNVSNMRHLFICDEPPETRFPEKAVVDDSDIRLALEMVKTVKL